MQPATRRVPLQCVTLMCRTLPCWYLILHGELKHKFSLEYYEGPEGEERYSSTLSLTSVLDGWLTPRSLCLRERDPVWTGAENLAHTGIRSPILHGELKQTNILSISLRPPLVLFYARQPKQTMELRGAICWAIDRPSTYGEIHEDKT
jgi:hypothetical protein